MRRLAHDPNASVKMASGQDSCSLPLTLYGCIGESPPGAASTDNSFECELNVGDIGLLVEYGAMKRCQGVCELRIAKGTPGWIFRENQRHTVRIPIVPQAFRPIPAPPPSSTAAWYAQFLSSFNRKDHPQIIDPEIILIARSSDETRPLSPPQVEMTLVMEYTDCVSDSRSVLGLGEDQPLPEQGDHLAILKLLLKGTRVPER